MSSVDEKLNSKGGGGLVSIYLEKVDGEVRVLVYFCKKPDSPKDMSSKKRSEREMEVVDCWIFP
eukprot:8030886-Ditylum_brightwellii.AAC.1